jgi:hypothetical protein
MPETDKNKKTEDLVIYICYKLHVNDNFGAVTLNKILYFIDNLHYLLYGKPISNFKYIKQERGPTPEPSHFLALKDKLISEGRLEEIEVDYFGKLQKKLISKSEPDLKCFAKEEIFMIENVIDSMGSFDAKTLSDFTHNQINWQVAELKEELPFYSYLLTEEDLTPEDIEWAEGIKRSATVPA